MTRACLSCLLLFIAPATAHSQAREPLLPRQPTLSQTHVAFCHAGDLWVVGREGGEAKRLTNGPAIDTDPVFSPDGSLVAFSRQSESGTDVYVAPVAGGEPRRLTYGWAQAVGWTRDGKQVVFLSYADVGRLFSVPSEGGPVAVLPPPTAIYGTFSPDGKRIAYLPFPSRHGEWKRYRGGATSRIWIADLPDCRVEKIPRDNSNDFSPMWVDNRIYFLSDRDGLISLFAYDVATKRTSKIIGNPESDILSASAGPGAIVYERFGSLHLYDFNTGKSNRLEIRASGEMPEVRPRSVKATDNLTGIRLSPAGDQLLIEARGELLMMPAGKGEVRNVTNSPGVFERFPVWSPDGRRIAYFSDESGEYALHIRNVDGTGSVKKIDLGAPPGFYFSPSWSPNSRKIAYRDHLLALWYVDVEKDTPVRIDSDYCHHEVLSLGIGTPPPTWSPDSRWLSYSRTLGNHLRALHIYCLETGQSRQVTDGLSDVRSPQFDSSGKYLYFAASTNVGPTLGGGLSASNRTPTRGIYALFLRESDGFPAAVEGETAGPVTIDLAGLENRIVALPVPARNYAKLVVGKPGVFYLLETEDRATYGAPSDDPSSNPQTLYRFDLAAKKVDKVIEGIRDFDLSFNGENMLCRQEQKWTVLPAGVTPKSGEGVVELESLQVHVDPAAEWRQMFREVWRAVRFFFYDPGYHGMDLKARERQFEPYLEGVATPADLNYLFREMLSELGVSHLGAYAGTGPAAETETAGLLGADYEWVDGRYRFARIYTGDRLDPETHAPLARPGLDIKQGDYLLAIDGQELRASDNIGRFLAGKVGKEVVLRIAADAAGAQSRKVTVVPTDEEWSLRFFAWADENRRKVEKLSGGRVAYIYLPDTGAEGLAAFDRYFFAQVDKEAVIIDERDNSGGELPDYFTDLLGQRLRALGTPPEGPGGTAPYSIIRGPKVMITNQGAFSGGDALAFFFKQAGLGPLIGTRTAGGLMGPNSLNLIDGGGVFVPFWAFYDSDGKWLVENEGVAPDIEVEQDPAAVRAGHDPQLEKAIEVVLGLLEKNPPSPIQRPPYRRLQ